MAAPAPPDPVLEELLGCVAAVPRDWSAPRTGDLQRLSQLAGYHRVTPVAYERLAADPAPRVGEDDLGYIKLRARAGAAHNLYLAEQLGRIQRTAAAAGVEVMGYKGPALAAQAYGSVLRREPGDLDLFVREADVHRAVTALTKEGFERSAEYHGSEQYHLHLSRKQDRVTVELHWAFAPRSLPFSIDRELLWSKRVPVVLDNGTRLDTFSPEHALPILSFHASKHDWTRLCWVCDLDRMITSHPQLDWDHVMDVSRRSGVRRVTQLGLVLTAELLGTGLPPEVRDWAAEEPAVRRLADGCLAHLRSGCMSGESPMKPVDWCLSLRERWQDRLPYQWHRVKASLRR